MYDLMGCVIRAETVLDEWKTLSDASTKLYNNMTAAKKPAFFQLVQHPVTASSTLAQMWFAAGKNNLLASQACVSTNNYGDLVEKLFEQDYSIETAYHGLLDGECDKKFCDIYC